MQNPRGNLLEGNVGGHLRRLSIPMAWGILMLTVFSVVDTWFIAKLGTAQLAAFGFTIPVVMFFMGIIFGLSVGASSAVARVYGSGDMEGVRQLSTDALTLTFLIVSVASILGFFLIDPVFVLMGAKPELLPMIHDFMRIWYCGLPFLGIMMIGNSCIRGTGDTKFPSWMMTMQAVVTLAIDPFLIFGWGGFPRLELKGAAITLVIAYIACAACSVYMLGHKRKAVSLQFFHKGLFKSWKKVLHVAGPSMLSNQVAPISASVVTWMAATYGREAVAALGIATRMENISTIVFFSLGAGVSIFSGQNYGAGNFGRIQEAASIAMRYCLIWGLILAAFFWVFAYDLPLLFNNDVLVKAYTAQYLHWVPVSFGAMGVMVISNASLNGIGKPLPSTALILMRALVIYLPLAYVAQRYLGFTGILVALMVTNFTVGIISYFWSRKLVLS